jgi:hypothetical protein
MLSKIQNGAYIGLVIVLVESIFFKKQAGPAIDSIFTYLLIVLLASIPIIGYLKRKKKA